MGFFMGFFIGIGAGVAFGEYGLQFPLTYQPKENGFGKIEVNLEVFNPIYQQLTSANNYFSSSRANIFKKGEPEVASETSLTS